MPYYRWRGVGMMDNDYQGVLFARSPEHLEEVLFKRHIALLSYKPTRRWFKWPIRITHQLEFFSKLATLVDAGILVPHALTITASQLHHEQLQEYVQAIEHMVKEGVSLSSALKHVMIEHHPLTIQLIKAGEESGALAQALDAICIQLKTTHDFYQRMRTALLMPVITLLFFLIIFIFIFTVIMPRFVDIFSSMSGTIPPVTKMLIALSVFVRSPMMGLLCALLALVLLVLWRVTRRGIGRIWLDRFLWALPGIGFLIRDRLISLAMRSVAVLTNNGMPLANALTLVTSSATNLVFRQKFSVVTDAVRMGASLSEAMMRESSLFGQEAVAMVEVGEESGRLPELLLRVSDRYYDMVIQKLVSFSVMVQPLIMIILGLLIGTLIVAVYGPLFTLSRIV